MMRQESGASKQRSAHTTPSAALPPLAAVTSGDDVPVTHGGARGSPPHARDGTPRGEGVPDGGEDASIGGFRMLKGASVQNGCAFAMMFDADDAIPPRHGQGQRQERNEDAFALWYEGHVGPCR